MRSRAKAHLWHVTVPVAVLVAVLGLLTRGTWVAVPLVGDVVAVEAVLYVAVVTVLQVSLYPAFGQLDATLRRERACRAWRATGVLLLLLVIFVCATSPATAHVEGRRLSLLLVMTVVAVTLIGQYGWMASLGGGAAMVLAGASPTSSVDSFLARLPLASIPVALVAAVLVYAWLGPRAPAGLERQ